MRKFKLAFAFMLLSALLPAPLLSQAPVPIVDGFVVKGFEGWQRVELGDGENGMKYMHKPRANVSAVKLHMGSAVWFFGTPGGNKRAAFLASAKEGGITNVKILAQHPMKNAKLLDNRGSGEAFIAEGTRAGKGRYKIAGLVIHGSLDKSKTPASGVHMFVAPADKYARMGGWIVPASLFLNLNPQTEVQDPFAQGSAPPAMQAARFAGTADIWSQWVLDTYIRMAQSNMQALSNFRKSVVCAGDPSCVIVSGP
jgi:hypothetical protein